MDVLRLFDAAISEQVIVVPKISCPSRPLRAALAATQMAEQLVEVPTDVLIVVPRQLLEQTVDIPVPLADLQGFTPGQSSTAPQFVEQNVDIPVPGGRGSSGSGRTEFFSAFCRADR